MRFVYCENCGKKTGYKRHYGWRTFFAVGLTFGLWFLVMPFYSLRCIGCGNDRYIPDNILKERKSVRERISQ
jgi:hypothetical protein